MSEVHELMGGELRVYKRENSSLWQCSTFLNGRNYRKSTKEDSLQHAKEIAEDWYLELRGKSRAGLLKRPEKTFNDAADRFEHEYEIITNGQRSKTYVEAHKSRLRLHLRTFFGDKGLSEIMPGLVQDYRIWRAKTGTDENPRRDMRGNLMKPPGRSQLHQEIVTLRLVLKTANRSGWLPYLPDLSPPYRANGKIAHRAWFSPTEYRTLYLATRERAKKPPHDRGRWNWECEQMHDYVLFMGNTGLRPDEADRLEFRDVKIVKDRDSGQTILEIEVRGKRGTGYCKSMPGAVLPFRRLKSRKRHGNAPGPTDKLFPNKRKSGMFNNILADLNLKFDREGNRRTAYSLRHTYICLRLMEGADIYQIAKNCRTSVEMIEKHYAVHLKTTLDAASINVRKSKLRKLQTETEQRI